MVNKVREKKEKDKAISAQCEKYPDFEIDTLNLKYHEF